MSATVSSVVDLGGTLVGLPAPDRCWAEVWDIDAPKGFPVSEASPLFAAGCCTQWAWGDADVMEQLWSQLLKRLTSTHRFSPDDAAASAACALWHTSGHPSVLLAVDNRGSAVSDTLQSLLDSTPFIVSSARQSPFKISDHEDPTLRHLLSVITTRPDPFHFESSP